MVHEAETQSPAITPAVVASTRRKRVILLCCEDLRPVACSLEQALQARGWDVSVEFGRNARPWVQKTPPGSPSIRVLCVPGRVDRELAEQLRTAYAPEPDADLHILGVDDSRGLVHEIERLAGVRHAARRPLTARPRLQHDTMVEADLRRERSVLVTASATLAAFAVTLGGFAIAEVGQADASALHLPHASITASDRFAEADSMAGPSASPVFDQSVLAQPALAQLDEPVFAAVAPPTFDDWDDELPGIALPPEEEAEHSDDDDEIIIFDDETSLRTKAIEVVAPPLADSAPAPVRAISTPEPVEQDSVTEDLPLPTMLTPSPPQLQLPPGFLPVAGFSVADAPAPLTTQDPFASTPVTATDSVPVTTVDPFASATDHPPTP